MLAFYHKLKWRDSTLLVNGISDTGIFNSLWTDGVPKTYNFPTIIDAISYIDSFLGSQVWQLNSLPYSLKPSSIEPDEDLCRQAYPGLYRIDYSDAPTNDIVYIDEREIPGKYTTSGNDIRLLNLEYPGLSTNCSTQAGKYPFTVLTTTIIITKDNFIVDSKISESYDSDIRALNIGIGIYPNNSPDKKYYVQFTPSTFIFDSSFWNGTSVSTQNDDPFNPGGDSGTGGGGGDFDDTSTPIEIPGLPTVSAASTGFISLFNPTLSQLNELASYMWSDIFDIDTLKKLFADPMDVILGLSILPVKIPTSGAREVKVGNIGTGISLNVASTQFVEVDCGTINVNEYWGAYLDYSPYTHAQIYLPYVGVRPISVDEIMGKSVNVNYHVDILTGACCCFVKCGDSVLYSFNGQCSIPIPISATNYTNTINGIISVAASLGTMVATGGATAPLAAASLASTITNQMKPTVEKSGAISGPGGVMGIQTPYLILTRPRQALPSKQNTFTGYPSFITVTLGELSGYTEVHSIHLENIPATADELSEIETLLKGGVIF